MLNPERRERRALRDMQHLVKRNRLRGEANIAGSATFAYPMTAATLTNALGGNGVWTDGTIWLCDEASGNLQSILGSHALTTTGTPIYSIVGPLGGPDKAVSADATGDRFDGGNIHNVNATDDLIALAVYRTPNTSGGPLLIKRVTVGWRLRHTIDTFVLTFQDGVAGIDAATAMTTAARDKWLVVIAAVSRATGKSRVGFRSLDGTLAVVSTLTDVSTIGDTTAVDTFRLFSATTVLPEISFAACVTGTGVGLNVPENMAAALTSFSRYIGGQ